jgi:hypothetical protein
VPSLRNAACSLETCESGTDDSGIEIELCAVSVQAVNPWGWVSGFSQITLHSKVLTGIASGKDPRLGCPLAGVGDRVRPGQKAEAAL